MRGVFSLNCSRLSLVFTDGDVVFLTSQQLEKTAEIQVPESSTQIQLTPDNSNLQGKSKKGPSYREFEENVRELGKKQFLLHSEHFNHI